MTIPGGDNLLQTSRHVEDSLSHTHRTQAIMTDAAVMQKFSICLKTPVNMIFLINVRINSFVWSHFQQIKEACVQKHKWRAEKPQR